MNQRPNVSWCFAPLCEANPFVPPSGTRRVLVGFDVTGIHHEPFHVRFVYAGFQQPFPDARIPPSDETAVRIAPPAVFRRQIAPWRPRPQNPEDSIDEFPVVLGDSAPCSPSSREVWFDFRPHRIRKVVAVEGPVLLLFLFVFMPFSFTKTGTSCNTNLVTTRSRAVSNIGEAALFLEGKKDAGTIGNMGILPVQEEGTAKLPVLPGHYFAKHSKPLQATHRGAEEKDGFMDAPDGAIAAGIVAKVPGRV